MIEPCTARDRTVHSPISASDLGVFSSSPQHEDSPHLASSVPHQMARETTSLSDSSPTKTTPLYANREAGITITGRGLCGRISGSPAASASGAGAFVRYRLRVKVIVPLSFLAHRTAAARQRPAGCSDAYLEQKNICIRAAAYPARGLKGSMTISRRPQWDEPGRQPRLSAASHRQTTIHHRLQPASRAFEDITAGGGAGRGQSGVSDGSERGRPSTLAQSLLQISSDYVWDWLG